MKNKKRPKLLRVEHVLTIDPGVTGTGVAYWEKFKGAPSVTKVLRPEKKSSPWIQRAISVNYKFYVMIRKMKPEMVFIEN